MGGLWVDYNLMSTIPGLFVLGEANFSDHGANRLGASALMQGLADGYFVIPYTIGDYLAGEQARRRSTPTHAGVQGGRGGGRASARSKLLAINGQAHASTSFHRELGKLMWEHCGMGRNEAGLQKALEQDPGAARGVLAERRACPGGGDELNQALEKAGRVADFLELGELMCRDALDRDESCGGHFREEYQTADGEALRDDEQLLPRRGLGVRRRGQGRRSATRSRCTFENVHARAAELQVMNLTLQRLAAEGRAERRAASSTYPARRRQPATCRSSRCSTWSTSS